MPTIHVTLEIEGNVADAYHVVDSLLDAGFFQDAINDHDADAGDLHSRQPSVVSPTPTRAPRSPDDGPGAH